MAHDDRLRRLAQQIDGLAEKDERLLQRAREIAAQRRRGACELHRVCADFVASVNSLLSRAAVELAPAEFHDESFRDPGVNLIQINVQGRLVQIEFLATDELVSTQKFKTPYILEGEVRTYNQEMLERLEFQVQQLFYCTEKDRNVWRCFDSRTYRAWRFDQDFLIGLMELLV